MVEDVDETDVCLLSTIIGSYFASNLENSPAVFCDIVKLKIFSRSHCESFHVFMSLDEKKLCTHSKI